MSGSDSRPEASRSVNSQRYGSSSPSRFGNFRSLPGGYRLAGVMDFVRSRKQLLTVCLTSLAIMALMVVVGLLTVPVGPSWRLMIRRWWLWFALVGAHLAYIALHELTHGLFMDVLSGVRPRYGFRLCYAYAGSDVWFNRICHNIIALAPVIALGIVIQLLIAKLPSEWFWPLWTLQIANVSGSAGDICCVVWLARMPGRLLIQDTGTRMRIFRKQPPVEERKP